MTDQLNNDPGKCRVTDEEWAHAMSEAPDKAEDSRTYKVGKGKPPKHTRYRPGQSGNPKGRRKGVKNFKTDVKSTLAAPVKVTKDGKPLSVSTQEAALMRLREKALGGDPRALDRLLALAKEYNTEEMAKDTGAALAPDDEAILANFKARVLRESKSDDAYQSQKPLGAEPISDEEGWLQ